MAPKCLWPQTKFMWKWIFLMILWFTKRSLHLSTKMKASSKGVMTFFWNYTHAFEGVKFSRFLFLFIVGFYRWMHMRKCFGVEWTMLQMEHIYQNASDDLFATKKLEVMTLLWRSCLSKMFCVWCCCCRRFGCRLWINGRRLCVHDILLIMEFSTYAMI
jgi:hypothetical protein